jgi:hypothetical protein
MSDTVSKKTVRKSKKAKVEVPVVEEPVVVEDVVSKKKVKRPRVKRPMPPLSDGSDDGMPLQEIPRVETKAEVVEKIKASNNWISHVKTYRSEHPEMSYKDALKSASDTYKK